MKSPHIAPLEQLLTDIGEIVARPADLQKRRESVSAWSVAQQLDHILKVWLSTMRGVLRPGEPPATGINWIGRVILTSGWIPRGRGRAPRGVHGTDATPEQFASALAEARNLLSEVGEERFVAEEIPVVRHPYFGGLTPSQTLRMIVVHTRHHLKIVREILG